jgi:hypothetical protein
MAEEVRSIILGPTRTAFDKKTLVLTIVLTYSGLVRDSVSEIFSVSGSHADTVGTGGVTASPVFTATGADATCLTAGSSTVARSSFAGFPSKRQIKV